MNAKVVLLVSLLLAGCVTESRRSSLPDRVGLRDQQGRPVTGACVLIDEVVIHGLPMYYSPGERALRTTDQSGRAWIDLKRQTGEDPGRYYFLVDTPGFDPEEVSISRTEYHGILVVNLKPAQRVPNKAADRMPGANAPGESGRH